MKCLTVYSVFRNVTHFGGRERGWASWEKWYCPLPPPPSPYKNEHLGPFRSCRLKSTQYSVSVQMDRTWQRTQITWTVWKEVGKDNSHDVITSTRPFWRKSLACVVQRWKHLSLSHPWDRVQKSVSFRTEQGVAYQETNQWEELTLGESLLG